MRTRVVALLATWVIAASAYGQPVLDDTTPKIKQIAILASEGDISVKDKNPTVRVGTRLRLQVMATWDPPAVTNVTDKALLSADDGTVGAIEEKTTFVAHKPGKVVIKAAVHVVRNGNRDDVVDPSEPGLHVTLRTVSAEMTVTVTADADAGAKEAPKSRPDADDSADVGKCHIKTTGAGAWRDWQPVVDKPGPDKGSRLHVKVGLAVDNSKGEATKLAFRAVVVDEKGQTHDMAFVVLPNFGVLPEDVQKTYRQLDEKAQKEMIAKHNVLWDGSLKPGETREVELLALNGPYLSVGSSLHVEVA